MKKILFYIDHEWSLGSIHIELVKEFYLRGINSHILSTWNQYTKEEIFEILDCYDYIYTTPIGYSNLSMLCNFQIPKEKFIVIAHATVDLKIWLQSFGIDDCNHVHSFGVVSNFLKDKSIEYGLRKIPNICRLGVNFDKFYTPARTKLNTIGYASTYWERNTIPDHLKHDPCSFKRAYLAKEISEVVGLDFKIAQKYHNSYVTMPGYYKKIDTLIMPSSEEGASMPVLEAAASGCLVISTPVGHVPERVGDLGADILDVEENSFINSSIQLINRYKQNDDMFFKRCCQIQEHARTYDWKYVIEDWINMV